MFHSWCMGSNLGNLDDSQEDGDARTGFLFVAKFFSVSHKIIYILRKSAALGLMIRFCPEVLVLVPGPGLVMR